MLALQILKTIWNHRAYNGLLAKPQLLPSTGEWIPVQLVEFRRWDKGGSKRANEYTFIAKLVGLGYEGEGVGTSNLYGEAVQSAMSEAFERLVYFALRGPLGFKNSNGFAAHPNLRSAIWNAGTEALERDALLVQWLTKTPFQSLSVHHETEQGQLIENALAATPFSAKHLLLSTRGWISTLTVVAEERWGGAAIVAHGTGRNLKHALTRTLSELERQATVARDILPSNPGFRAQMDLHTNHYIFSRERLARASWLVGYDLSWENAAASWRPVTRKHIEALKIEHLANGHLHVVRASGAHLQQLYFGKTEQATLNPARLQTDNINLDPHFVA